LPGGGAEEAEADDAGGMDWVPADTNDPAGMDERLVRSAGGILLGMAQERASMWPAPRVWMVGVGICGLVLAVVAFSFQLIWLAAAGSLVTALAAIGLAWSTLRHRDS
jgi:hypothetical protein